MAVAVTDTAATGHDVAADVERAAARNDALINRDLIRRWLLWGFFWTMLAPTVGVIISTKFNYPSSSQPTRGRRSRSSTRSWASTTISTAPSPTGRRRGGQVGLVRVDAVHAARAARPRRLSARSCWYCHSQYVRPVAGEDQRWGPVSEVGTPGAASQCVRFDTHQIGAVAGGSPHPGSLRSPTLPVDGEGNGLHVGAERAVDEDQHRDHVDRALPDPGYSRDGASPGSRRTVATRRDPERPPD